jgi:HAD superfamily hydrolase (TIGR01549 family)
MMNSPSKIRARVIVFDQGNTLIMDPFSAVLELQRPVFREVSRRYGVECSNNSLEEAWKKANIEVDYPFCTHFTQEEPIVQRALQQLKVPEDVAAFLGLDLLREYREGLKTVIANDPRTREVKATLERLAAGEKRLAVFSNDRRIGLGLVLKSMGIRPLFQYIETSDSIGIEKPDPRVFQHLISFFQTEPGNIAYVGDDPIRDIEPAKSQGLQAIFYKVDANKYTLPWRDYSLKPKIQPDAVIERFSELADIIE